MTCIYQSASHCCAVVQPGVKNEAKLLVISLLRGKRYIAVRVAAECFRERSSGKIHHAYLKNRCPRWRGNRTIFYAYRSVGPAVYLARLVPHTSQRYLSGSSLFCKVQALLGKFLWLYFYAFTLFPVNMRAVQSVMRDVQAWFGIDWYVPICIQGRQYYITLMTHIQHVWSL